VLGLQQLNTEQARKRDKREALELLKEAHYAVLSLSAVVSAHPYDTPDYLPQVLILLTRFQNSRLGVMGQQILTNTIKHTFSEFNRTHRASESEWEQHKAKFSSDDLMTINSLQYSSHHYA
jgi:proteasome activator subunit 4